MLSAVKNELRARDRDNREIKIGRRKELSQDINAGMTSQYPEIRLVSGVRALCAKRPVRNRWLNRSRRLRNISLIEPKERFLHKKLVEGQMNRKKCKRPSGASRREQKINAYCYEF
ncbi:hypothetical protein TNIN_419341 [Trichonephila inaurata madagascariensis]|uniref:Uncharacterized protein n=1 Tax=Trichonephila inaurata madagascariensis TaxID=2747483 RepID=A0A8X6XVZ4_9ARAC|nr:hypothetical protein TNIN_419341 [Trichonephila inaurata madagascariensis]